jgi:hypothetical protein
MTWRELANAISAMPSRYLDQSARYVEPYDKDRDGYEVDLITAEEDIYVGPAEDGVRVFVKAGEPFLR